MAQAAPERRESVIRLAYLPPAGGRHRARANHLTNTVGSIMGAVGEDRLIYRFELGSFLDSFRDRIYVILNSLVRAPGNASSGTGIRTLIQK